MDYFSLLKRESALYLLAWYVVMIADFCCRVKTMDRVLSDTFLRSGADRASAYGSAGVPAARDRRAVSGLFCAPIAQTDVFFRPPSHKRTSFFVPHHINGRLFPFPLVDVIFVIARLFPCREVRKPSGQVWLVLSFPVTKRGVCASCVDDDSVWSLSIGSSSCL